MEEGKVNITHVSEIVDDICRHVVRIKPIAKSYMLNGIKVEFVDFYDRKDYVLTVTTVDKKGA